MNKLEDMISKKLPTCGLKAEPHIESRLKHWSEKYYAMAEMLGMSGYGWDDVKKVLQVERTVFDKWTKAKGLYGVPFPHYDILAEIYGKDRATGEASEPFILSKIKWGHPGVRFRERAYKEAGKKGTWSIGSGADSMWVIMSDCIWRVSGEVLRKPSSRYGV